MADEMTFHIETWSELSKETLYEILQIRSTVFVVEQKCAYRDTDGIDQDSIHYFIRKNGKIAAYLRAFTPEGYNGCIQIGRVLTVERGTGLGMKLMCFAVEDIRNRYGHIIIRIEAQTYAAGFYEKIGFTATSDPFDEDGIEHIEMKLNI